MTTVYLGNPAPHEVVTDPETSERTTVALDGPSVTKVHIEHDDAFAALLEIKDLWRSHGAEPPTWVASDAEGFADMVGSALGTTKRKTHAAGHAAYVKAAKGASK